MPSTKSNTLPFYKSVRFKLTLFYSVLVYLFTVFFVLAINLSINNYFESLPDRPANLPPRFQNIQIEPDQQHLFREIRLADLKEVQRRSLIALVPLALISFGTGYVMSGVFLRPVKKLQSHFDTLDEKELGFQVDVTTDDEFGQLTTSFNELSKRLKNSFDLQTRFIQDASHEIKTPLTIIKTNLEVIADDKKIAKDTQLTSIMADVVGSVDRLKDLTNQLLDLSRDKKIKSETVLCSEYLKEVIENVIKNSNLEKTNVKYEIGKDLSFSVDQNLLSVAIGNIILNASKYGRTKSGDLKLKVVAKEVEGEEIQLEFSDAGPGIQKDAISNLFDRFYTVDSSRSRTVSGYGLGLAICKQIVEAHKGEISAENVKTCGAKFVIRLPIRHNKEN